MSGVCFGDLAKLKELVTCSLCLGLLCDGRMLSCTHSFCLACLEQVSRYACELKCPECFTFTLPPVAGLTALPRNVLSQRIVQLLRSFLTSESLSDRFTCGLCKDLLVDHRQLFCSHSFCLACLKSYQTSQTTKQCPTCFAASVQPDTLVEFTPTDDSLEQVIEIAENDPLLHRKNETARHFAAIAPTGMSCI